jgi:hypothetical protein
MSDPAIHPSEDPAPREIRRYSNRKLYDTAERRFTSLPAIENLVRDGIDFVVVDHDSGVDLTEETLRRVLSARPQDAAVDSPGLLFELIRSPARVASALADGDRDIAELRELRQQVNSLSVILESLLDQELGAGPPPEDTPSDG